MKKQGNDKEARRKRRAQKAAHKTYKEEKPIKMDYYTLEEDSFDDIEAAVSSLNIPTRGDWYY